jgi:hypothetical protein
VTPGRDASRAQQACKMAWDVPGGGGIGGARPRDDILPRSHSAEVPECSQAMRVSYLRRQRQDTWGAAGSWQTGTSDSIPPAVALHMAHLQPQPSTYQLELAPCRAGKLAVSDPVLARRVSGNWRSASGLGVCLLACVAPRPGSTPHPSAERAMSVSQFSLRQWSSHNISLKLRQVAIRTPWRLRMHCARSCRRSSPSLKRSMAM